MDRYRRLVDSSPDGILIVSGDRIRFANRAAGLLLGVTDPAQLEGQAWLARVHDASRPAVGAAIRSWETAGACAPQVDARVVLPDGRSRDLGIAGSRLPGEDGVAVQLVIRDITSQKAAERALRESEERLALAVAGGQEGIWDWNLETNHVVYSARWMQMLGYTEHEIEPNVSAWERLVHPEDRPRADRAADSIARGARATYEAEFRLRHKDGHYVHVLSRGFPVRREPGGPVVRIVGMHFDLTERKQAEAARARSELLTRLVFAQEDERRRISREMHDQFGAQLTALAQRIRSMKSAADPVAEWWTHVAAIEAIAQQLDRDVDHLVWELRPTALDDLGLRAALANYVQNWSSRVGITATLHTTGLMEERLPSHAETALYRIAQEALTNVAKHAGAATVGVILERKGDQVSLIVEDDGVGFDPSVARAGGGAGLVGMKERAGLVGATLDIESSPGQGTTVFVRLEPHAGAVADYV